MLERHQAEPGRNRPAIDPNLIQFYSIELMPTAYGRVAVGIMATLCEHEGELEGMDLGSHRGRFIRTSLRGNQERLGKSTVCQAPY